MDSGGLPPSAGASSPWRPPGCDKIGLVLQGGGALGAYQVGVYQALNEAGLEPDWTAGVSIGGINAALIAGNRPENRLARMTEFWNTITARSVWLFTPDGDDMRKARNTWSSFLTMSQGQPGFFKPHLPPPWLSPRGASTATSYYDTTPLRETLLRLVDFDVLNSGATRYACGAVNVANGNFAYFDNSETEILPEHIMASGALPPALPMVRVGTDHYWDGGLVSNTPLQHLLDNCGSSNMLVFQVDLFSARGPLPRDMMDVTSRMKDIQYSSRTRMVTDNFTRSYRQNLIIRDLLDRIPDGALSEDERRMKRELANMPEITILQLVYQPAAYEGDIKSYEFSGTSMREHWQSGYLDTQRTLRHKDWLTMTENADGVVAHDIHRLED